MIELITQREFASTFHRGEKLYDDYTKAIECYESGLGAREIGKQMDRDPSYVSEWLSKKRVPHWKKAVDKAKEIGLFPLEYGSEQFRLMNFLSGWNLVSGSVEDKYRVTMCATNEDLKILEKNLTKFAVGVKYDPSNDDVMKLTDNGAIIGRILGVLGLPVNVERVDTYLKIPVHVLDFSDDNQYLSDFLNAVTRQKMELTGNYGVIRTPRNSNSTRAKLFTKSLAEQYQRNLDVELVYSMLSHGEGAQKTHYGRIYFTQDVMPKVNTGLPGFIKNSNLVAQ